MSSNENDVPFDVKHVRVIYYDMTDPFWGTKLIDKVAENILSALKNPAEAVLFGEWRKARTSGDIEWHHAGASAKRSRKILRWHLL